MKPHIHAENSAKEFGGVPEDYIKIHEWFDDTKAHFADHRHRALKHHTQGIFEAERLFGRTIINADGNNVSVRDVGEQHVMEDLGIIPTVSDYLNCMTIEPWMGSTKVVERLKENFKFTNISDIGLPRGTGISLAPDPGYKPEVVYQTYVSD